jgi:hypothetical protein
VLELLVVVEEDGVRVEVEIEAETLDDFELDGDDEEGELEFEETAVEETAEKLDVEEVDGVRVVAVE